MLWQASYPPARSFLLLVSTCRQPRRGSTRRPLQPYTSPKPDPTLETGPFRRRGAQMLRWTKVRPPKQNTESNIKQCRVYKLKNISTFNSPQACRDWRNTSTLSTTTRRYSSCSRSSSQYPLWKDSLLVQHRNMEKWTKIPEVEKNVSHFAKLTKEEKQHTFWNLFYVKTTLLYVPYM